MSSVFYTYDDLGRVSVESFENDTKTVYSYNANGNVCVDHQSRRRRHGVQLGHVQLRRARVPAHVDGSIRQRHVVCLRPLGQLTRITLPGGRTITYNYDADGNPDQRRRLRRYRNGNLCREQSQPSTRRSAQTNYTYDKDGNLLSMTEYFRHDDLHVRP